MGMLGEERKEKGMCYMFLLTTDWNVPVRLGE